MSDTAPENEAALDPEALRSHAEHLERELAHVRQTAEKRIIWADLTVEAVKAGMVDLDGLKLLDVADLRLNDDGHVAGASTLMTHLRRTKPWLFGGPSSSNPIRPPPAPQPRQKLASEMSDDEYRAARALIVKRHV